MAVVGRLDQYASMLCQEFDEVTVTTNVNISGFGTYFATEFSENVGITTTLTANVFPPYDPVYDEFGGTLFGAGQGRYMRQNTDQTVIVYNEIDEVTDFYGRGIIVRDGLVFDLDASVSASYPGSGTTWTDLIRNTISTLENGVVFNSGIARGVMSFDGVDDRVTFANTAYSLGSTFSIEVWSYWNSASAPANNPWAGCMYTNSAVSDWNVGTGSNSGLLLGFNSMRYKNISNYTFIIFTLVYTASRVIGFSYLLKRIIIEGYNEIEIYWEYLTINGLFIFLYKLQLYWFIKICKIIMIKMD